MAGFVKRIRAETEGGVQTITGTLPPGERIDIGRMRFVNDAGDLIGSCAGGDGKLDWAFLADNSVCISNIGGRKDEGIRFARLGELHWLFAAKVRPETAVVRPPTLPIPLVSLGQGDYRRDWPELDADNQADDQAAGLRAAVAQGGPA